MYDFTTQYFLKSNNTISIGFWNHLAIVSQNGLCLIYINGTKDSQGYLLPLNNLIRTSNYIGFNNWDAPAFNGEVDDFIIYHEALNSDEILEEFNFINHF